MRVGGPFPLFHIDWQFFKPLLPGTTHKSMLELVRSFLSCKITQTRICTDLIALLTCELTLLQAFMNLCSSCKLELQFHHL